LEKSYISLDGNIAYYPKMSFKARRIVHWTATEWLGPSKKNKVQLPKDNTSRSKTISNKAATRIRDCVTWLIDSSSSKKLHYKTYDPITLEEIVKTCWFRINFITLTLPSKQVHDDVTLHEKVFKQWIRWWQRKEPNLLYIWKAETQKNRNLHYHLCTNSFIPKEDLTRSWNHHLESLGYVSRSRSKVPQSTNVKAVWNEKKLQHELAKYISKKDFDLDKKTGQKVFRRIPNLKKWAASAELLKIKIPAEHNNDLLESECTALKDVSDIKKVETGMGSVWLQLIDPQQVQKAPNIAKRYRDSIQGLVARNQSVNAQYLEDEPL